MRQEPVLIDILANDLQPVTVQKPIRTTVRSFFVSIVATLLFFGLFFRVRSDLQAAVSNHMFLFSTFTALIACLIGFFCVVFLSTPGRNYRNLVILNCLSIITMALLLLFWPNENPEAGKVAAKECSWGVIQLGLLSLLIFGFVAKKRAPTNPGLAGLLCGVGAAFVGMSALAFSCLSENSYHLLIWHFSLPLIALAAVGFGLGRQLLRW